jgi:glyoxylase-like metal-dependent hydrolase (beta-lactamase superfamily II)
LYQRYYVGMSHSRREFFQKSVSVPLAAQARTAITKPARSESGFAPAAQPQKLLDNLFLFEDTCNVFVIRDGSNAVLVDFGSGKILAHLGDLGIGKIDWILHTHHHRDQCQGDAKAVARGIPIAVPAHEHTLFSDAENFWRNRRVFHLYYMRNDFNTITHNIPVARLLTDYSTFRWRNHDISVQPTPGHTLGSITLIASIDGKRIAFSGDLLHSPGKIVNLFDTQVNYGGEEGIDLGIYSLAQLREQKPEWLCPSHGPVMRDADTAMAETMRRLRTYYNIQFDTLSVDNRPYAISPHLVASYQTTSSFYTIVSDTGKAMFIDYGAASDRHFNTFMNATATGDRIRFVEHSIGTLKRDFGVKSVDVAMPSHMHDDHMNGFPHLKRNYGTKVWCLDNMVDIFENPRGYNLGCILGEAFKVDRPFRPGEKFKWEEFEFEITHSPGHTEYQMALFVTIDGQKVAFTGDAFFPPNRPDGGMRHNLIFRNHVENDSHLKSIRNLIDHEPALIAPGHGKPYGVTRDMMLATEQKFRKQQQMFFEILPEGEVDFGLDPSWVSIYPYQILIAPGSRQPVEIRVRNYKTEPMKVEAALIAPPEWQIEPRTVILTVPAGATARQRVNITVPRSWTAPMPRFAIACDVMRDGRYLGQITEAVVEIPV